MKKENIKNILIESVGVSVLVQSDDHNILSKISESFFLKAHIPSVRVFLNSKKKPLLKMVIRKSGSFSVDNQYPIINLFVGKKIDIHGVIVLIDYFLERARHEKGAYSVHSSCIVRGKKAIIIFGGTTNLGKTTLARCMNDNFSCSFFFDEKTLIKGTKVIGGVSYLSNCDNFSDQELVSCHGSYDISAFVHPHIDNGKVEMKKWHSDKFFWHLHEELSRRIRGGSKMINFFKYPLLSLDTFQLALKRIAFSRKISKNIPCYEIRGTPMQISKIINKKIWKK